MSAIKEIKVSKDRKIMFVNVENSNGSSEIAVTGVLNFASNLHTPWQHNSVSPLKHKCVLTVPVSLNDSAPKWAKAMLPHGQAFAKLVSGLRAKLPIVLKEQKMAPRPDNRWMFGGDGAPARSTNLFVRPLNDVDDADHPFLKYGQWVEVTFMTLVAKCVTQFPGEAPRPKVSRIGGGSMTLAEVTSEVTSGSFITATGGIFIKPEEGHIGATLSQAVFHRAGNADTQVLGGSRTAPEIAATDFGDDDDVVAGSAGDDVGDDIP
jgi:hypothetical protein